MHHKTVWYRCQRIGVSVRKFIITDIFSLKTPTNCHHDNSTTVKGTIIRKKKGWEIIKQLRPQFIRIGRKNNENLKGLITWSRRYLRSPLIIISSCHLENNLNVKGHIWNLPLTYNFADSGKVKLKNERYSSWNAARLLCSNSQFG